ncbi:uncharacterized protein PITG_21513 [Phytophthora infestans T30-4]|uniref:Uncharacterized protein n=1 Tax=Phytophthora infestans (strain T30-4) TaxID=403677 RepID=D0P455_PHYIT|nr:uncharacterized protein PITG_21513 [Phytophthora infestans T30-4]EEY63137.1 hypothetical protein PITG_21513 [Phytophthora infestans T30-4]|eukprot:XP_002894919.1 hypothetical protein PITG_21513 [Phytophthora infestans T30-4]
MAGSTEILELQDGHVNKELGNPVLVRASNQQVIHTSVRNALDEPKLDQFAMKVLISKASCLFQTVKALTKK